MLVMAILSVFIAGLMVGRTPEYLGKKIEGREMKLAMLYVLIFPTVILLPAGIAVVTKAGLAGISNPGPHGFSQILYAFSEAGANNGSAFGGLNANAPFYNWLLAFSMLFGRFMMMIPALALAGSLAPKRSVPQSAGTFPDPRSDLRGAAGRGDPDRRSADLLPGRSAGTNRRAPGDGQRKTILTK